MTLTQRSRGFCVTDFELNQEFWEKYKEKCDYIVRGQEKCPETGRIHWQMYIHVPNPRTLRALVKDLKPRHVEIARGCAQQNDDYCTKDDCEIWRHGRMPKPGERLDLKLIQNMVKEGKPEIQIADTDFPRWCQYGRRFEAYRALVRPVSRDWQPEVYILYGEPGSGKTRFVHENHLDVDSVSLSGNASEPFVLGYRGGPVVLFDDFEPKQVDLRWMLRALDRYPMKVNIKGGEMEWLPRYIYLTTNLDPFSWWDGNPAFRRRVTEFRRFVKNDTEVPSGNTGRRVPLPEIPVIPQGILSAPSPPNGGAEAAPDGAVWV